MKQGSESSSSRRNAWTSVVPTTQGLVPSLASSVKECLDLLQTPWPNRRFSSITRSSAFPETATTRQPSSWHPEAIKTEDISTPTP